MVHPLIITAAATAGVGAAVALELAVFRPWREENWPNGFREGIRVEFDKIRRDFEESVQEIRDEFSSRRSQSRRRRPSQQDPLTPQELDEFRRAEGEDRYDADRIEQLRQSQTLRRRSSSSVTARSEFDAFESQASAYRDRINQSLASGLSLPQQHSGQARRRPAHSTLDETARNPFDSPELPHHHIGECSPSIGDTASLRTTPPPSAPAHPLAVSVPAPVLVPVPESTVSGSSPVWQTPLSPQTTGSLVDLETANNSDGFEHLSNQSHSDADADWSLPRSRVPSDIDDSDSWAQLEHSDSDSDPDSAL